jgi:hypothetical protein
MNDEEESNLSLFLIDWEEIWEFIEDLRPFKSEVDIDLYGWHVETFKK